MKVGGESFALLGASSAKAEEVNGSKFGPVAQLDRAAAFNY